MSSREVPKFEREAPVTAAPEEDDSAAVLEELQSAWFQAAEDEHALADDLRADVKAMMSGGEIDLDAVRSKIQMVTGRRTPIVRPQIRPTRQVPRATEAHPVDSAPLLAVSRIVERPPEKIVDKDRLKLDRAQIAAHLAQLEQQVEGARAKQDYHAAESWQKDVDRKRRELQQINQQLAP